MQDNTQLPHAAKVAAIKQLCEQSRATRGALPTDAERKVARAAAQLALASR